MEYGDFEEQIIVAINNSYQLKIHSEKQIAEILGLSRSQVKNLLEKGEMELKAELPQFISISITFLNNSKNRLTIFTNRVLYY